MSVRPLSEKLQEKAKVELNEVPKRLQDDINYIVEWINQQPHLNARTEAQWIVMFLRGCKFSLQKTKQKLDLYYTMRTVFVYYFTHRNPFSPEVQRYFKLNIFIVLPEEPDSLKPQKVLLIAKNGDPNKISVKDSIKSALMLTDIWMHEYDAFVINGVEVIIDFKDAPLSHVAPWTPNMLKLAVCFIQDAYPSRIKAVHVVNVPSFAEFLLKTLVSFLSEKIRNRVHFYSSSDDIYKIIPRAIFPDEYGGKAGPLDELSRKLLLKLEAHSAWYQEDSKYGTDESLRPGKSIISDEFFNMEGSFRKLDID